MEECISCCPFDASAYTGVPDAEPTGARMDVPALIRELDGLIHTGRAKQARAFLEQQRRKAAQMGDWRGELSILNELLGQYRFGKNREKGLQAVEDALALLREHRLGGTVSGATVLLNAATTLKCFDRAAESLPMFQYAARVYAQHLDPGDYRFAGLYNNMALSYLDVGDYAGAERHYKLALEILARCDRPENDLAVTLCGLAELYDRQDPEDPRIGECMEGAWERLNAPGLAHDGYHMLTLNKCIPAFDYFGYFLYAKALKERRASIREGT